MNLIPLRLGSISGFSSFLASAGRFALREAPQQVLPSKAPFLKQTDKQVNKTKSFCPLPDMRRGTSSVLALAQQPGAPLQHAVLLIACFLLLFAHSSGIF